MPQGALPYKYEEEKTGSGITALAGLPLYLDLASVFDVGANIAKHLQVKVRGWTDEQIVLSLILLNLAGGDAVDDIDTLEKDQGFCKILSRVETKGLTRQQRRTCKKIGIRLLSVIPAKAGIQELQELTISLDSGFHRRDDQFGIISQVRRIMELSHAPG